MYKIKFIQLKIENFGPYKGLHTLNFSTDDVRNITLIKGLKIGTGKTSLNQCIRYVIYGHNDKSILKRFVQRKAIKENNEFRIGGTLEFSIYEDEDCLGTYEIQRHFTYENGNIGSEKLEYYKEGELLTGEAKDSFEVRLSSQFFNRGIQTFLFIQGEKLDDLFQTSYEDVIKRRNIRKFAIELSELPIIERYKDFLDKFDELAQKKLSEEQSNENSLYQTNQEIEKKVGKKNEIEIKIVDLEEGLSNLDQEINDLIHEIEVHAEQAQEGERLNGLKKELEKQKKIVSIKTNERSKIIRQYFPILYLEHAMRKCYNDLIDKEGILWPKNIDKKTALTFQKNSEKCEVCGREWDDNSIKHLQQLIDRMPEEFDNSLLIQFRNTLNEKIKKAEEIKGSLQEIEQALRQERRELNRIERQYRSLNVLVEDKYSEDSWLDAYKLKNDQKKNKEIEKSNLTKDLKKAKLELVEKNEQGKIVGGLIKEIENKKIYKKSLEKQLQKSYYWRPIIDKVEIYKKLLSEIQNGFTNKLINIIEDNTLRIFKKLHWDPEIFKDAKVTITEIDDGWDIELEGAGSTGELQLVGLSYIIGLTNTIDVKIPIFIDAPFVVYDITTKKNLAIKLPELMEGTQLIFYVKDQELENIEQLINPKSGYCYRINKIDIDESIIELESMEELI